MDKLNEIIETLDKELDNLFNKLDLNIPKLQNEIRERLFQFLNKLKTTKGSLVASVENLKILQSYQKELSNLVEESKFFPKVIQDFTLGINLSTKYVNDYFSILMSSTNFEKKELFTQLKNVVINDTVDLLVGSGLQNNLILPVKDIIRSNITTGSSFKELQTQISNFLDNNTQKYVKQITNDAVLGYERNYMITIANDLELEYYLYQGTKIETSRPFCKTRVGKVFTQKEVQNWANLDWNGKRQGTNKDNILYFVGGYNCRHRLLPISKETYNFIKEK